MYETSQGVVNHRVVMAQTLGMPVENVRVVTRFLGSGFGGKLSPGRMRDDCGSCAQTGPSGETERYPAHDVFKRRLPAAHRTARSLGASKDGKLLALKHDYLNVTSMLDDFDEGCGEATPYLYSVANLEVTSGSASQRGRAHVHARPWRGSGTLCALNRHERAGG